MYVNYERIYITIPLSGGYRVEKNKLQKKIIGVNFNTEYETIIIIKN